MSDEGSLGCHGPPGVSLNDAAAAISRIANLDSATVTSMRC